MSEGRIILSGDKDLALRLEAEGYDRVEKEHGTLQGERGSAV
jgi:Fe-S cluster assembly ATPase SufC